MAETIMTRGKPWKVILTFALPMMAASLLQQLYNTADTLIIGNFESDHALAAVGSCAYLVGLFVSVGMSLALGAGICVSQAYGAKDYPRARQFAGAGSLLVVFIGLAMAVIAFLVSRPLLENVIAVPDAILEDAVLYAHIYAIGIFFQFGYCAFSSQLRAIGDSRTTMFILMATTILNILLDLFFVAWLHWGVAGVAIATTICQFFSMALAFVCMVRLYPLFYFSKLRWKIDWPIARDVFKTGIPLTGQSFVIFGGFMVLQNLVNSFGVEVTASFAVSGRLELYMLVPLIAVLQAVSTYAGQNYGAQAYDRLIAGMKQAILLNVLIMGVMGTLGFILAPWLVSCFGVTETSAGYAVEHLRVASIDLILYAIYSPISGICLGIGKSWVLLAVSTVELTGRIIFANLLADYIGVASLWWNEPPAWMIVVIGLYAFYFCYLKKRITTPESQIGTTQAQS